MMMRRDVVVVVVMVVGIIMTAILRFIPQGIWQYNDSFPPPPSSHHQSQPPQEEIYHPKLRHFSVVRNRSTTGNSTTTNNGTTITALSRALTRTIREEEKEENDDDVESEIPSSMHHHHYHRLFIPTHLLTDDHSTNGSHHDIGTQHSNVSPPSIPTPRHTTIEIPILIQLSGELGNHLSKIAAGIGVAAMIHAYNSHNDAVSSEEEDPSIPHYQFTTNLQVRHQDHTTKGDTALLILQQCFPHLLHIQEPNAKVEGDEENVGMTAVVKTQPKPTWPSTAPHEPNPSMYHNINSHRASDVDATLHRIVQDAITAYETVNIHGNTTIPWYVYSNHLVGYFDVYMDRYYDLYRQYFIIDETNPVCGCLPTTMTNDHDDDIAARHQPPDPDIVFYYRGYHIEMPKKAIRLGYEEISPNTLVSYLQNITTTTTTTIHPTNAHALIVRIVSRFPNHTQPYVTALTNAGYIVQQVEPHGNIKYDFTNSNTTSSSDNNAITSILHDFCVLRRATKFIIGPIRSTYYMWATILADRHRDHTYDSHNPSSTTTTTMALSSLVHVTAYTTPSQIDWALQSPQQHDATVSSSQSATASNTAAIDSITPTYYYHCNDDSVNSTHHHDSQSSNNNNISCLSLWEERNFHFITL